MMKRGLGGEFRDRRFSPQTTPNHHSSPSKLDSCTCKVLFGSVIECFQTMVDSSPYVRWLSIDESVSSKLQSGVHDAESEPSSAKEPSQEHHLPHSTIVST